MDIVCMYCGRKYGEKPGSGVSHGVCGSSECKKKLEKDMS